MTEEERQLLLADLCARLPYGVNINLDEEYNARLTGIDEDGNLTADIPADFAFSIDEIKPYLRPMESMTEEELKEFVSFTSQSMHRFICGATNTDHWYNAYEEEDWLLAHHFDYRGLIEKGLVLEAPEGMYKLKQ